MTGDTRERQVYGKAGKLLAELKPRPLSRETRCACAYAAYSESALCAAR